MDHTIVQGLLFALVGYSIFLHFRGRRDTRKVPAAGAAPPPSPSQLYVLASALYRPYEESAHPSDLTGRAELQAGAAQLAEGPYTTQDLLAYYSGDNAIIAIMALEALTRRDDDADLRHEILAVISSVAAWTRWFALRLLDARTPADRPVIGALLLKTDPTWTSRLCCQFLQEFVSKRLAGGEVPSFEDGFKNLTEEHGEFVQQLLQRLDDPRLDPLATQLDHWRRTRIDAAFLESVGRLWKVDDAADEPPPIEHEGLRRHVQALEAALTEREPRSILVVGESGVGKSAIVRALGRRLQQEGWVVFEAGGGDLIAGQVFVGSLEERLRKLVQQIGGQRRVLWYVPEFHGLYWAGRSMHNETSALDYLLPHLEQGRILMIGETHPAAYERLVTLKPRCVTALEARRVEPLPTEATLALARDWARVHTPSQGPDLLPEATLREALHLAQQYLGDQAAPGSLLKFLDTTRRRLVGGAHAGRPGAIQVDDLIVTLTQLTGLPESILDDRHNLDLDALRRLFERRVLGQPEAAACLVDRVAMIKAGLTDPTRPQGVFLFAGPTGTGKTEIAKTLAEFLFGSAGRMIRIDMSEMESPDSLHRLLGSVDGRMQGALVDQIRRQPFSVVLLDEFEKAHPNVWDLFLQVFDDGRLTDRMGNTADFRQAIVIMTSNLGGRITSGAAPGFVHDGAPFRAADIERAIGQAFRPEFLNRIDRVVVFHPLGRETMREILHKELDEVTRRRGLRSRSWAIEWDDDAIEFLLAKGFTPDLGARPLKRAIERYLLSPLAVTIVDHQFPEGDQFLFVRAEGDRLVVEFVDPDASQEPAAAGAGPEALPAIDDQAAGEPLEVAAIAFDPRGTSPEIASLRRHYERIADEVQAGTWQASKQALLERTSTPRFWTSPERFGVLGAAEYMDRIEHGVRGAGSLLDRLLGSRPGSRERYPADLVGRLAQQLYLLEAACAGIRDGLPREAFVLLESGRDAHADPTVGHDFARRIGGMYRAWAHKRRMQLQVLEESAGGGRKPYRLLLAVSGYGAYPILRLEEGLHVLELPSGNGDALRRCKVRVRVVPQPDAPAGHDPDAARRQAVAALGAAPAAKLAVVRRYRDTPPLVRDRVRGWRSGKLERILGGDFDLVGAGGR